MIKATVIELLQDPNDLDDFGREMVKTRCRIGDIVRTVYVQHPTDNRKIVVGYVFEVPS